MKRLIFIFTLLLAFAVTKAQDPLLMIIASSGGVVDPYGPEEVSNGTFDGNITGWSGTNWAYSATSGGVALHTAGATSSMIQNTLVVGKTYHMVFTVGGLTAGSVRMNAGNGGSGTGASHAVAGTFTEDLVCFGDGIIRILPSSDFDGWVDNVSVKEVL